MGEGCYHLFIEMLRGCRATGVDMKKNITCSGLSRRLAPSGGNSNTR